MYKLKLDRNSNIFFQENAFENIICKMVPILSWPQCVNTLAKNVIFTGYVVTGYVHEHILGRAITWTNVDQSSPRCCGIHMTAISDANVEISILDMSLKMNNIRLQTYLPGVNELILKCWLLVVASSSYMLGKH